MQNSKNMKIQTEEKTKYGRYCRKSEEDAGKQVNSIKDQERDLDILAEKEKLNVVIKFEGESQSAFTLGRPIFADVIKCIEMGKINSLLVWHANRLSRNPIDAGMLIYLMDMGKLREVKTPSRTYYNNANDKFLLQLDFSMSKKDSDDKSIVVKRALEGRALRGLPNGMSKIGFLNDKTEEKGNRKWIVDPLRFPLVKKLFKRMLTGRYSPAQMYRYAIDDLKLTTVKRKKEGGVPIAYSYIYIMLRDPIFAGFFFHNGKRCELDTRLPRVITEEEYWKIQAMLGAKGRPQPKRHEGLYNHFLICGQCNGRMSHDPKFQLICSNCRFKFSCVNRITCPKCEVRIEDMKNPTYCSYVYYACLGRKKGRTKCVRPYIEEKIIEETIKSRLTKEVYIDKAFSDWCLKHLSVIKDKEIQDEANVHALLNEQEEQIKKKLNNLLSYRITLQDATSEQVEIFNAQEKGLQQEWSDIKQRKENKIDWYSEATKEFNLMTELEDTIENGTRKEKREALYELRSNLTILDKNVIFTNRKSIEVFSKCLIRARAKNKAFEPKKSFLNLMNKSLKEKTEVFSSVFPVLLRG